MIYPPRRATPARSSTSPREPTPCSADRAAPPAGLRPATGLGSPMANQIAALLGELTPSHDELAWASAIIVAVAAGAIAAMLFVRRRAPEGSYFEDGDRAAGVFGVLATGFAVLAGSSSSSRSRATTRRAAAPRRRRASWPAVRDGAVPTITGARASVGELVCYARSVVHLEWPRMESGTLDEALNPWSVAVFRSLRGTEPRSASEQAASRSTSIAFRSRGCSF